MTVAAKQVTAHGFGQYFVPGHIRQHGSIEGELLVVRASVVEDHDLGMKAPLAAFTEAAFFGDQFSP